MGLVRCSAELRTGFADNADNAAFTRAKTSGLSPWFEPNATKQSCRANAGHAAYALCTQTETATSFLPIAAILFGPAQ